MADIKTKLRNLPKKPGIYTFRDKNEKVIYIGKALSLKHRVSSYFQNSPKDPKTEKLIAEIANVEYQVVNSEFEALLLEAKLIREYRPYYNILGKDGHRYVYLAISKKPFPALFLTRHPEKENNLLDWYGPFPSVRDTQMILKTIRRIFPFCQSRKKLKSPCFYHHLNLCPGVCAHDVPDYPKTIGKIRAILSGKTKVLLKDLEKEMKLASKLLHYEEAQKLKQEVDLLIGSSGSGWRTIPVENSEYRKTIIDLRKLITKHQGVEPTAINKIEGYDISNLGSEIMVGSQVVFVNGEPDKALYRKYKIRWQSNQDDPAAIGEVIRRRLTHPEWLFPQLMLIDGGKTQLGAAFEALVTQSAAEKIALIGLTKEEETIIVPKIQGGHIKEWKEVRLPRNSKTLQLLQSIRDEAHRFAQKYYKELHRKRVISDQ